jgi:acyl-CoA synthetase (AMP-forming)/AMP-acid ligase II
VLEPTGLLPDDYVSLADQIVQNAEDNADAMAFVSVDTGDSISWAELLKWTSRLAHFLRGAGIHANDRVVVLGENSPEHLILYYGIQAYGAQLTAP